MFTPTHMPPAGAPRPPGPLRRVWWCHPCAVSWYGAEPVCWCCEQPTEQQTSPYRYYARRPETV